MIGLLAFLLAGLPPGLSAERDAAALPLPVSGYQVYLLGETHGARETADILAGWLERLEAVRDVALEEDAVYEREAQAYVEGKSDTLPRELCLRANLLDVLRLLNRSRPIRVHLVDVDSPAAAIRRHLLDIRTRTGARVRIPAEARIKAEGPAAVARLKRSGQFLNELRTIEHSIGALRQGFEVTTDQGKGSPYLDEREAAIAANLRDLASKPVLALYGADHVSKTPRRDGGPNRDRAFSPMAVRLEQAGLKVYSLLVFPLAGSLRWRGRAFDLPYTAADGSAGGEALDSILAAAPGTSLLYADPQRVTVALPARDASALRVDGILMLAHASPMEDRCAR